MRIIISIVILLNLTLLSQNFKDDLNNIDADLLKSFPRWKVLEPDLQYKIYQYFKISKYDVGDLDMQNIEVLAVPRTKYQISENEGYDILLISCGRVSIQARYLKRDLQEIYNLLSGDSYSIAEYKNPNPKEFESLLDKLVNTENPVPYEIRKYAFKDIPAEFPVKPDQGAAIRDYLMPTNVDQALTLSLFDQTLKIGSTDFWLQNKVGNDQVGLPYYTAGESKIILKRPLYVNNDPATNKNTPYLINAYLGGAYKITTGLENGNSMFSWLPNRKLNSEPNGKLIFGMDLHMPFHPAAGLHVNIESPINSIDESTIELEKYGTTNLRPGVDFNRNDIRNGDPNYVANGVLPVLGTTGQVTAFYNLWLNEKKAENYFRFDLGISYAEVKEYLQFAYNQDLNGDNIPELVTNSITRKADGLKLYHPDEFADWLFAKVEYRNQAVFPFSLSLQYSNQSVLARAYMPLFGDWLLLEAKYSTPLRDAYEYEVTNFFIISPVIRIAIN